MKEGEKETVSVIVPVYNREDVVAATLESIKGQTYRPLHVVLVDNGSTDSSLSVLLKWREANDCENFRVTVVEEPTPGASAARNRGARETDADKLLFFDSDDIMYPSLIETAVSAFDANPGTDIVAWRHVRRNLDGSAAMSHAPGYSLIETQLIHTLLPTHAFMVRRGVFESSGGWDESLPVWNDYELGVRLLLVSTKIKFINEALYEVVSRRESITGTSFSSRAGEWEKSLCKIERSISGSDRTDKERLLRIVIYRRIILAAHYAKEGRQDLAESLKTSALSDSRLTKLQKQMLKLAFSYTARGGRGAWLLLRHFL